MENTQTYNTIIDWKISILDSVNIINAARLKLNNQLSAMRTNEEYTEQDCLEVEDIINEVNNLLSEF